MAGDTQMKVIRIMATDEGESRFTEIDIPIENVEQIFGETVRSSNAFTCSNMKFYEFPASLKIESWHGAPIPQIVIILSGGLEIETGDGEKRQWRAGELFIADDTNGKHKMQAVVGPGHLLNVPLPPNFVIERWSA
jgi:hypothetical protein